LRKCGIITAVFSEKMNNRLSIYLILAILASVVLFFRLGALPFLGADECRYAGIAEEMSGAHQWVTPILEGLPWLEKPPLYYWMTIPFIRLFGMSEAVSRMAPAFCALLSAAVIAWLGRRLYSRSAGLWSGIILLSSIGYCAFGRSASMDMPFTACLTVAMALWASAILEESASWRRPAWAGLFIGLAALAKGPVAFLLVGGILVGFWVFDRNTGSMRRTHLAVAALTASIASFPWFWLAFRENGYSFISIFFINHNFARYVTDIHHHDQPIYYFIPVLLGLLFPWSGWLPALLPGSSRLRSLDIRTWDRGTLLLVSWAAFPFAFFSLSGSKLPGYVLPCIPPIALLLGRRLAELAGPAAAQSLRFSRWFFLIFSLLPALALPIFMQLEYGEKWKIGLYAALPLLVISPILFALAGRGNPKTVVRATAAQGILFLLAMLAFASAPIAEYHSTREIAAQAMAVSAEKEPLITYFFFHYTLRYYTGYRVGPNITDPQALIGYARQHPTILAITEDFQVQFIRQLPGLSISELYRQGKLRLLRISCAPSS
jgi:4-amino-4-deoxy-L-arabinose transferase-like glycosyltransferase